MPMVFDRLPVFLASLLIMLSHWSLADSVAPQNPYVERAKSGDCQLAMLLQTYDGEPIPYPPYFRSGLYTGENQLPDWTIDWYARSVSLLDCDRLVRYGPWASRLSSLAVSFYFRGAELMSYEVGDLVTDKTLLKHTTSHFFWKQEQFLNSAAGTYMVETLDGHRYTFSIDTGEILHYKPRVINNASDLMQAVQERAQSMSFASEELKNDRKLMKSIVRTQPWAVCFAGEQMKSDPAIARTVLSTQGHFYYCFSDNIKRDRIYALLALRSENPVKLNFIASALHTDREVVLTAVQTGTYNYWSILSDLNRDPEVVRLAIEHDQLVPLHSKEPDLRNNKSYVISALRRMAHTMDNNSTSASQCAGAPASDYISQLCNRNGLRMLTTLQKLSADVLEDPQVMSYLDDAILIAVLRDHKRFSIEKDKLLSAIRNAREQ